MNWRALYTYPFRSAIEKPLRPWVSIAEFDTREEAEESSSDSTITFTVAVPADAFPPGQVELADNENPDTHYYGD